MRRGHSGGESSNPRGRPASPPDLSSYEGRIGHRLRTLRLQRFRTMDEFVEALANQGIEVTNKCVSTWERGTRQPHVTELWRIAKILKVTLNELIPKG